MFGNRKDWRGKAIHNSVRGVLLKATDVPVWRCVDVHPRRTEWSQSLGGCFSSGSIFMLSIAVLQRTQYTCDHTSACDSTTELRWRGKLLLSMSWGLHLPLEGEPPKDLIVLLALFSFDRFHLGRQFMERLRTTTLSWWHAHFNDWRFIYTYQYMYILLRSGHNS